ncbi:sulfotransferase domain-containing protein [soil metagenome]
MIIWIASYPRSGNTLTRAILHRSFGLETYSVYSEHRVKPRIVEHVGAVLHGKQRQELIDWARASRESVFIKTHELPPDGDGDLAIFIVRDGRAATSSYHRFLQVKSTAAYSLGQVVAGTPPLLSWSDHARAWRTYPHGRLLTLRFEDLISLPARLLEKLSAFIGYPILREFDLTFADFQDVDPVIYSRGYDAPGIAEIESICSALFWSRHGDMMQVLGYGK